VTLKRTIGYTLILLVVFCIALFIVLVAFSFFIPQGLQSIIISEIRSATGLTDFSMQVRELDLSGADFGDVHIGDADQPALIVRSIQLDYTAGGLVQKKIKKVTASGIELFCEFKNDRFGFRGVELESVIQRLQSRLDGTPSPADGQSLLALERLELRDVTLNLRINSTTYRISADIDIIPENMAFDRITATAEIYSRGHRMTLTADIDLENKTNILNFSAQNLILARFADLTEAIDGLHLSGRANIDAKAKFSTESLKFSSFSSVIDLHEIDMQVHGYQFQNKVDQNNEKHTWRVHLEAINADEWKMNASDITISGPLSLDLSQLNFKLKRTDDALQGSGAVSVLPSVPPKVQPHLLPFSIADAVPINLSVAAQYSKAGDLSFRITNQLTGKETSKRAKIIFKQHVIKTRAPKINISGNVNQFKAAASCKINIPEVELAPDKDTRVKFPAINLNGSAEIDRQAGAHPSGTFKLRLPGSIMTTRAAELRIPQLTLSGQFGPNKLKKQMVNALLQWDNTSLVLEKKEAALSSIKGQLPVRWPAAGKLQTGSFTVGRFRYRNMNVGKVHGTIQQTQHGFDFNGVHLNSLIPELKLEFQGTAKLFQTRIPQTRIQFQNVPSAADIQVDLGKFLPRAGGVSVEGKFSIDGHLFVSPAALGGALQSSLDKGRVLVPDKKIAIEGIRLGFSIPDLPNIRSAPQQILGFDRAAIGELEINDGKIEFQIESPQSVLVEKSQFKWVGGNVDAHAVRISPGIEDYSFTLYCDRVNLAMVLEQLGVVNVEADGELNGKIPLQYKNGKLHIDDGFLFSTPDKPRKIRMTGTELFTAGLAPGTVYYNQMELARKALEDYDYDWVKLNINSEGEDLLIRMQFDGKPSKALPFVYKKELGGFAKIEAGGKGSIFEGIHLNVNFRLPLNKMLQYKEIIQMIQ
jgi:hypothetical protein